MSSESPDPSQPNLGPIRADLDLASGLPATAKETAIVTWPNGTYAAWLVNPDRTVSAVQIEAELTNYPPGAKVVRIFRSIDARAADAAASWERMRDRVPPFPPTPTLGPGVPPLPTRDLAPGIPRHAQHEVIVTWLDGTREMWLTDSDHSKVQGQIDAEMKNHPPAASTYNLPSHEEFVQHMPQKVREQFARQVQEEASRKAEDDKT